jgi:DNA-binding response OmpR family regulator
MAGPIIGIANHDPVLIRLLDQVLTEAGFQTIQLPQGARAYDEIKKARPDLIILDTWLESREAGWILFQVLRLDRETREIPVLICSSDLEEFEKRAAALEEHSHVGVLNKPFDIDVLIKHVNQMLSSAGVAAPSRDGSTPD